MDFPTFLLTVTIIVVALVVVVLVLYLLGIIVALYRTGSHLEKLTPKLNSDDIVVVGLSGRGDKDIDTIMQNMSL